MNRILLVLVFFGIILSFSSCFEEPEVQLLQSDKELIDSIYTESRDSLQLVVDSLCLTRRNLIYTSLIDSFKQVRLSEIEEFLK